MGDERNPDRRRATIVGENGYPMFVGPPWSVVGANDIDRNGYADVVWHNSATGETQLWLMNGTRIARRATVLWENGAAALVGLPWSIVGIDDFDADGKPDILWHNASTSTTQIWYMDTHRLTGRANVLSEGNGPPMWVGLPWRISQGTNDFDRDKIADVLWHNEWTGETRSG